ncbi:hypothetical protein, partial [Anaerococcus kampingiae]
ELQLFGGTITCGTFPWLSPFGEVISLMTIIHYEMPLRRKIVNNNIILDNKEGFLGAKPLKLI